MPVTTAVKQAAQPLADPARRIVAFLRGFSIEASRLEPADLATLSAVLPPRTAVYLTALPNRPPSDAIEPARRLHALGFDPVPHLAARALPSHAVLDELSARLAEAGVRRVLVIGGERTRPEGPFGSALDLIESGLLQRRGIVEIGIAAYPDGHPNIAPAVLERALTAKIEAAEQTGLAVHIVTQFGFDAAPMLAWLRRLRAQGIEHPVRIGMAGPANLATMLRFARRCGVRASTQGLMRHPGLIKHVIGNSTPDGIIRPLAEAQGTGLPRDVAAHFYSFGGVAATARWVAAAAAGRILLDRAQGFGVEPA